MQGLEVAGENSPKRSFDSISREWATLLVICIGPLFFLVDHLSGEARAMATSLSVATVAIVIKYFWDLRTRVWFWITLAFITSLHFLFIVFLPAPGKQWNYLHWNYVQLLPLGLLDFAIAYGIIRVLERMFEQTA